MNTFLIISNIGCVLMGAYVLIMGNWENHYGKRAGVMLTTTCALFICVMSFTVPKIFTCEASEIICDGFAVYYFVRNIAFMVLIYCCGNDALAYGRGDRRNAKWMNAKLSSKPAHWPG